MEPVFVTNTLLERDRGAPGTLDLERARSEPTEPMKLAMPPGLAQTRRRGRRAADADADGGVNGASCGGEELYQAALASSFCGGAWPSPAPLDLNRAHSWPCKDFETPWVETLGVAALPYGLAAEHAAVGDLLAHEEAWGAQEEEQLQPPPLLAEPPGLNMAAVFWGAAGADALLDSRTSSISTSAGDAGDASSADDTSSPETAAASKVPPLPPPQTLICEREHGGGVSCVSWSVDARKLKGSDKVAVSPPFEPFAGTPAAFKMMLCPRTVSDRKGGACFRKAKGRASVQLKCETALEEAFNGTLAFRISAGGGAEESARGPVRHDFSHSGVAALPQGQDEWDFSRLVDEATQTFTIRLEILAHDGA